MLTATDTVWAPWHVVHADDKKRARLNIIIHLLGGCPTNPSVGRRSPCPIARSPGTTRAPREPPLRSHAVLTQDPRSTMTEVASLTHPPTHPAPRRSTSRPCTTCWPRLSSWRSADRAWCDARRSTRSTGGWHVPVVGCSS
jgi:hypothetical protein